ncbi:MAG TPA: serine protease [Rhodospirillaceae bacterium]|nr:serine protease [Rhodospirillaceae bacterium]
MRFINRLFVLSLFSLSVMIAAPSQARSAPESFADLAEKLLPAVVNISTTQTITQEDEIQAFEFKFPEGSPFEDFFKEFQQRQQQLTPNGEEPRKRKATSLGSGFVIDPTGYIVTNNHVVQDADEITVILQDDTNLPAKVVGRDKKTDLAVLKVETKKPLPALTFGDSDKIRVGDWILAIGNPYGLGGTVTAGIISARARDINSGPYDDYLQTDAPINRGNSGGPMFNMAGEVIGVNTAIFSPSGGSIGIGFAIPASMAKNVIEQLKTTGSTKRGWIGVRIQAVTPEIAESLGLGTPRGALVSGVTADGPASRAKVEVGDVIVSFDGKSVNEMHRLPRYVADTEIEKAVPMTVVRKGKEITLQIKVGKLAPDDEEEDKLGALDDKKGPALPAADKIEALDISVAPLTEPLRKRDQIGKDVAGVVIVSANPNGLAAEYGLQAGDVITEASQKEIKTSKELADITNAAKDSGKPILLLVDRKGELRFIAIKFEKKK